MKRALLVASCLLPMLQSRAQTAAQDPETAFMSLWNDLPHRSGWQMLVSPPFPATWPQPPGGTVVRYAFAMRLNPTVADGAEMSAPWAKSTRSATGVIAIERLSNRLRPLGIQGVRPLRSSEIAVGDREPEMARLLFAGGTAATNGVVREVTCAWIARQGVVAAAIMPLHPSFTKWLACP